MLDTIMNRASYRGKYKDTPVPREHLEAIMKAGLAAPSGCNKQTTSLIGVDDPELLEELKALIPLPIGKTAPAFILVLAQKTIAYKDTTFYIQDYSAAIQNMLLAMKALGYDSCWYEGQITDDDDIGGKLAKHLSVPEEYKIVCLLPVGVAADEIKRREKKAFDERAWFNGFRK